MSDKKNAFTNPSIATMHRLGRRAPANSIQRNPESSTQGNSEDGSLTPSYYSRSSRRSASIIHTRDDADLFETLSGSTTVHLSQNKTCTEANTSVRIPTVNNLAEGAIKMIQSISPTSHGSVSVSKISYTPGLPDSLKPKHDLDLRNNDNSFHVLASLLVEFFHSRVKKKKLRLEPEDRSTIERLIPESARIPFIDAVRYRLALTPFAPVTPLHFLTYQCQELGLDLEGDENPIVAACNMTTDPVMLNVLKVLEKDDESQITDDEADDGQNSCREISADFVLVKSASQESTASENDVVKGKDDNDDEEKFGCESERDDNIQIEDTVKSISSTESSKKESKDSSFIVEMEDSVSEDESNVLDEEQESPASHERQNHHGAFIETVDSSSLKDDEMTPKATSFEEADEEDDYSDAQSVQDIAPSFSSKEEEVLKNEEEPIQNSQAMSVVKKSFDSLLDLSKEGKLVLPEFEEKLLMNQKESTALSQNKPEIVAGSHDHLESLTAHKIDPPELTKLETNHNELIQPLNESFPHVNRLEAPLEPANEHPSILEAPVASLEPLVVTQNSMVTQNVSVAQISAQNSFATPSSPLNECSSPFTVKHSNEPSIETENEIKKTKLPQPNQIPLAKASAEIPLLLGVDKELKTTPAADVKAASPAAEKVEIMLDKEEGQMKNTQQLSHEADHSETEVLQTIRNSHSFAKFQIEQDDEVLEKPKHILYRSTSQSTVEWFSSLFSSSILKPTDSLVSRTCEKRASSHVAAEDNNNICFTPVSEHSAVPLVNPNIIQKSRPTETRKNESYPNKAVPEIVSTLGVELQEKKATGESELLISYDPLAGLIEDSKKNSCEVVGESKVDTANFSPEKENFAKQQLLLELREASTFMAQSQNPETAKFWSEHVVNLQSRLKLLEEESASKYTGMTNPQNLTSQSPVDILENNRRLISEFQQREQNYIPPLSMSASETPAQPLVPSNVNISNDKNPDYGQPMVDVIAPADLPGGYHFEAEIDGQRFLAVVPAGGVRQGEAFTCYMRELDSMAIDIPVGYWKDDFTETCKYGCGHPVILNTIFCPLITLSQIQQRTRLDFLGRPKLMRPDVSNKSTMVSIIAFWATTNLALFAACNLKWSRGLELTGPDISAFALINIAMLAFVIFVTQSTRSSLRERFMIREERCLDLEDLCCATWCLPCTICQMARHTANYDEFQADCCSNTGLPEGVKVNEANVKEQDYYYV